MWKSPSWSGDSADAIGTIPAGSAAGSQPGERTHDSSVPSPRQTTACSWRALQVEETVDSVQTSKAPQLMRGSLGSASSSCQRVHSFTTSAMLRELLILLFGVAAC